jgi:hypothetical protein
MCECGASLCGAHVALSGSEYNAGAGPVLASGHGSVDGGLRKWAVCGRWGKRRKRR